MIFSEQTKIDIATLKVGNYYMETINVLMISRKGDERVLFFGR